MLAHLRCSILLMLQLSAPSSTTWLSKSLWTKYFPDPDDRHQQGSKVQEVFFHECHEELKKLNKEFKVCFFYQSYESDNRDNEFVTKNDLKRTLEENNIILKAEIKLEIKKEINALETRITGQITDLKNTVDETKNKVDGCTEGDLTIATAY